ncbi:glycosyltransferase family 2 protein [Lactiplantibacillus plantarum]|uniref:glycosyltransferase family 2 protein n=1 Tax=Lactiplantibacillus plantarum TaxID=1590 RepID=UPI001D077962|nr:glycosyltransferase family 2 protein [Lactiplantibacillus plantarum]MCB7178150.1 glycosyltransferase [Lactiplantibacillus plantarum]
MDISVVIPVYNVKDYLKKAVESLENQKIAKMEIILVDDGSKDGTDKVVDKLAREYSNVRAIHQSNSGAAAARNKGIDLSSGKYLYFMDPDDWMESDMLQKMFMAAEDNKAQLVISGFTNEYYLNKKYFSTLVQLKNNVFDQQHFRTYTPILLNNTTLAVPWNKLYLSKYIKENHLYFPQVKWDDLHFNMDAIRHIEKVVTIDNCSYHFYRTRPGSETTKVFDGRLFENRKNQFHHVLSNYRIWGLDTNADVMSLVYYYYATRMIQVIQEIASASQMNLQEKKMNLKVVLNDTLTQRALLESKSGSFVISFCFKTMKTRYVVLNLLMGKLISIVKDKLSNVFYRKRVNVMKK